MATYLISYHHQYPPPHHHHPPPHHQQHQQQQYIYTVPKFQFRYILGIMCLSKKLVPWG